tara:strand:+ start:1636 stop:2376 length:741 start_codon:yes stop_codon:yes gene_type:complete
MSETVIKVDNVSIKFPKTRVTLGTVESSLMKLSRFRKIQEDFFVALNGINLEVNEGEILGIIGRNGSGKSTLLRTISGIYRPDKGSIKSKGQITLMAGLGIGFNVNLSGRENVYLYGSILGNSNQVMNELMDSIIDFSELNGFIDQPLRTYSAGMRARLGFSIASAVNPDILLIDEVLSVGDQEFREKSMARILEIVEGSRTVIIVSHNFTTMEQMCTRLVMIEKGEIIANGNPTEVIAEYSKKVK